MFGITSESAAAQAKVILIIAIVWLAMAVITRRRRKVSTAIYAAIGALFEVLGLYFSWMAMRVFSYAEIINYFIMASLIILFLIISATYLLINLTDKKEDDVENDKRYDISLK